MIVSMHRMILAAMAVAAGMALPVPAAAQIAQGDRFGDWSVGCEKPPPEDAQAGSAPARCFIFQDVVTQENQQQVLLIAVGLEGDRKRPAVLLRVPLGLYLPAGLVFAVPGAEPLHVEIETCLPEGCRGGALLNESILNAMRRGERARVTLTDLRQRELELPVSLIGFTKGFAAVQAQK
jgi:invasion protein IalB